jgi:hypothetical protein
MGKTKDLTPWQISGIKTLINTESYLNWEICRTLVTSESFVKWINKNINLGEQLCPQRTSKCGRKPIFTQRSECCPNKIFLENRFATTKQMKLNLKSKGIMASKINFRAHRPARKPKLISAMVTKRLTWVKDHKDRDLDFRKSVNII